LSADITDKISVDFSSSDFSEASHIDSQNDSSLEGIYEITSFSNLSKDLLNGTTSLLISCSLATFKACHSSLAAAVSESGTEVAQSLFSTLGFVEIAAL